MPQSRNRVYVLMVRQDLVSSEPHLDAIIRCIEEVLPQAFPQRETVANVRSYAEIAATVAWGSGHEFKQPVRSRVFGLQPIVFGPVGISGFRDWPETVRHHFGRQGFGGFLLAMIAKKPGTIFKIPGAIYKNPGTIYKNQGTICQPPRRTHPKKGCWHPQMFALLPDRLPRTGKRHPLSGHASSSSAGTSLG